VQFCLAIRNWRILTETAFEFFAEFHVFFGGTDGYVNLGKISLYFPEGILHIETNLLIQLELYLLNQLRTTLAYMRRPDYPSVSAVLP